MHKFTLIELGCAGLMLFTHFGTEGNGMLLICGIILILDGGNRFLRSRYEDK